jgi:hypothetical protein
MGPGCSPFAPNNGGPVVAQPTANITDKRIANPMHPFKYELFTSKPPFGKRILITNLILPIKKLQGKNLNPPGAFIFDPSGKPFS